MNLIDWYVELPQSKYCELPWDWVYTLWKPTHCFLIQSLCSYYQINSNAHIPKSKSWSIQIFVLWPQCSTASITTWQELRRTTGWKAEKQISSISQYCLSSDRLECITQILFSTSQDKYNVLFITSSNATIHSSPLDNSHRSYRRNVT